MNVHQFSPTAGTSRSPGETSLTAEVGTTRTELTPAQELLGAVIAQAAVDCRAALKRQAEGKFRPKDIPLVASACRFFLSESGHSMIHACGLGHEGVRAGIALAQTAMRRLGLSRESLLADTEEAWKKLVASENIAHVPAMTRPREVHQPEFEFSLVA